ncbi:MAG: hypothetical protein MK085_08220 [Phycisphaerales bacterium]|nr:hypothetical protein [Phycisphaerales bacterium]
MTTLTRIALSLFALLLASPPAVAEDEDAFRFLSIPIRGIVGIDVTPEGVRQAIALAKSEELDGIVLQFDSDTGQLEVGKAIAGMVQAAGKDLRTVAILRQAGGPALPIVFACQDWLVLNGDDQTPADRVVVASRPAWPGDEQALARELETLHTACLSAMIDAVPDVPALQSRTVFARSLMQPGFDLLIWSTTPPVQVIHADAPTPQGGTRISVAANGPGIDLEGLEKVRLATRVDNTLESLANALAVSRVVSEGDPGQLLVNNDADEQYRKRQVIGTLIDNAFATIDGIDSLSSAFPWTLQRAIIADPGIRGRSLRYPMEAGENGWVLTETGRKEWKRAADNAARRWRGVIAIADELTKLIERGRNLQDQLDKAESTVMDEKRLHSARELFKVLFDEQLKKTAAMLPYAEQGRKQVADMEAMADTPPTIPFPGS